MGAIGLHSLLRSPVTWLLVLQTICLLPGAVSEYVLSFDGSGSYVTSPLPPELGDGSLFSLGVWVQPGSSSSSLQAILSLTGADLKHSMTIGWSGDRFLYVDKYLAVPVTTSKRYSRKQWHYVALTMKSVNLGSYLDAEARVPAHRQITLWVDGNAALEATTIFPDLAEGTLAVGAAFHGGEKHRFFAGLVDEVRVYKNTLTPELVLGNSFLKPEGEDETGDLYAYFSFNDVADDWSDSIQRSRNLVYGRPPAVVGYATRIFKELMPYDPIALMEVIDNAENEFENSNYGPGINRGPSHGSNVTVTGANFANSQFLSLDLVDGDLIVKGKILEYINSTTLIAQIPPYGKSGRYRLQITNGGFNARATSWSVEYIPGIEWWAGLEAFYSFSGDATNAVDRRNNTHTGRVLPGTVWSPDRNGVPNRALSFEGNPGKVEVPPLIGDLDAWTFCAWIKSPPEAGVLYAEHETHRHRVLHTSNVIEIVVPEPGAMRGGYGCLALDGVVGGQFAWDAWQLVCVAKNFTNVTFWASGSAESQHGEHEAAPVLSPHTTKGVIAANFSGLVDDVFFWSRYVDDLDMHQTSLIDSGAFELDGSGERLEITNLNPATPGGKRRFDTGVLNAFSVEAWVNPFTLTKPMTILTKATPAAVNLRIEVGGGITFYVSNGGALSRSIQAAAGTIVVKKWQLVTATYSGTVLTIYVDGVSVKTATFTPSRPIIRTDVPIIMGQDFNGQIGEIRLWTRDLGAAGAKALFTCPPSPQEEYLTARFLNDEGVGRLYYHGFKPETQLEYVNEAAHMGALPFWVFASYLGHGGGPSLPLSSVAGPGLLLAAVRNESTYFTAQLRDSCKRLCHDGGAAVHAVVYGPTDMHTSSEVLLADLADNGDGTFTGTYSNITLCGHYALRVEGASVPLLNSEVEKYKDQYFSGSPFHFFMQAGPMNASQSYAYAEDSSDDDSITAVEGGLSSFLVQAVDSWGCQRSVGGDVLNVTLAGRYDGVGTSEDLGNGKYRISYSPLASGPTRVAVTLGEDHVGRLGTVDVKTDCTSMFSAGNNTGSPFCAHALPGGAPRFVGVLDSGLVSVVVSDADHLNAKAAVTMQAWVRPHATSMVTNDTQVVVGKVSPRSQHGFYLGTLNLSPLPEALSEALTERGLAAITHRVPFASFYVGSDIWRNLTGSTPLLLGEWNHIAATYNGRSLKLYVNGQLDAQQSWDSRAATRENSQPLVIGRGFSGNINEVAFFTAVRSAEQIAATTMCPINTSETAGWWRLHEGSGTVAYDQSPNNATGSLTFRGTSLRPVWEAVSSPSDVGVLSLEASNFTGSGVAGEFMVGEPATFAGALKDKCGFGFSLEDFDSVSAEFENYELEWTSDGHTGVPHPYRAPVEGSVQPVELVQDKDLCVRSGAFTGNYSSSRCGLGKVTVRFDNYTFEFPNISIKAEPRAVANQSIAVVPFSELQAGQAVALYIIPNDHWGCHVTEGLDSFVVLVTRIAGPNPERQEGSAVALKADITWRPVQNVYEAVFTPPADGVYSIAVGLRTETGIEMGLQVLSEGKSTKWPVDPAVLGVFDCAPAPWRSVAAGGEAAPVPSARYEPTTAVHNGTLYVFRGWSADKSPAPDVWSYPLEPASDYGRYLWRKTYNVTGLRVAHEVRLSLDTASLVEAGKIRADCADIKVVDAESGEVLPHWLDPIPGCFSPTTGVWVAAPHAPAATFHLYYGNAQAPLPAPGAADAAARSLFVSFDGFEDGKGPLESGWTIADTCSIAPGSPEAFTAVSNWTDRARPGDEWVMRVDPSAGFGGGGIISKAVGGRRWGSYAEALDSFVLRGQFYDADANAASHWISPEFGDCQAQTTGKNFLLQGSGLGVFTSATPESYVSLYPWRTTGIGRSAGWHSFEFVSDGDRVVYKVDDIEVGSHRHAAPLSHIYIRGGSCPGANSSAGWWDNIYVARYDPALTTKVGPEEAVLWEAKTWTQVRTRGRLPSPRKGPGAVQFGDSLYLIGGFEADAQLGKLSIWKFGFLSKLVEPVTPWGSLRPMAREDHSVAQFGDSQAVIFGGRHGAQGFADIWIYDFADEAWLPEVVPPSNSSLPLARFGHSAVVYGNLMYVFGGFVPELGAPTNELWTCDLQGAGGWTLIATENELQGASSWTLAPTEKPKSPKETYRHTASVRGGSMYVAGGMTSNEVWRFDFALSRWESAHTVTRDSPLSEQGAAFRGLDLFLFGGHSLSGAYTNEFLSTAVW